MADEQNLRWGIIGTGNIANQFAKGVAGASRSVLAAVGSRTDAAAEAFAQQHGIDPAHAHGSYEALCHDERIDAVYVSLPNAMHHEWTVKALEAGKHVLCEKPFAVTVAEANEMFEVAERHDRRLVEAFMYRCHPLTRAVVEELRSGSIGELKLIKTSFNFCITKTEGNVRFSRELAGGALMDIGCYCISFSVLMAGRAPAEVHASGQMHATGVDEMSVGTMRFENGVVASFACGMRAHADNAAELCGTEGFIEVPVPWKPPVKGAEFKVRTMTPPRQDQRPGGPSEQTHHVDAPAPLYGLEADAFAAHVLDDADPAVTKEETLTVQRVLDQMRAQVGVGF